MIVTLASLLTGCETIPDPGATEGISSGRPTQTDKASPTANVTRLQAWKDAEMLTARGRGRVSAVGAGKSMAPIYGESTMLVIAPIDYGQLEPGMNVAYANRRGFRVVHQLLEKTARGWRVKGLNNEWEDAEYVTRDNLVGVVYASLSSGPLIVP